MVLNTSERGLVIFLFIAILLPGLLLSALILTIVIFKNETELFLTSIKNQRFQISGVLWKSKQIKIQRLLLSIVLIAAVINTGGYFFSGFSRRQSEESETYWLLLHTVKIQPETFSFANAENGPARVNVRINDREPQIFNSRFNYDLLANSHAVYVNYSFYNLDIFPDLLLSTTSGEYIISGFTGNLYPHSSILTSLLYR